MHCRTQDHLKMSSASLQAYCTNRITYDLAETRCFLYKTFSSETNKLPPTAGAFLQHVLRAFCQIGVWKSAHLSIIDIPNVIENGCEVSDGMIMPVCTRDVIAPEDLIELVSCNCKGNCARNRCKCHESDEACTDFCGCDECVNSDMALPENVLDENDEEDSENDFDFETVNVLPEDYEEDAENDLDLEV